MPNNEIVDTPQEENYGIKEKQQRKEEGKL